MHPTAHIAFFFFFFFLIRPLMNTVHWTASIKSKLNFNFSSNWSILNPNKSSDDDEDHQAIVGRITKEKSDFCCVAQNLASSFRRPFDSGCGVEPSFYFGRKSERERETTKWLERARGFEQSLLTRWAGLPKGVCSNRFLWLVVSLEKDCWEKRR